MTAGSKATGLLRFRFVILLGMMTLLLLVAPAVATAKPVSRVAMVIAFNAALLSAAFALRVGGRRGGEVLAPLP